MKKDKELLDQELGDLAPFLRDLRGKDDGFRMPERYFESLDEEVFKQIDAIGARRKVNDSDRATGRGWLSAPTPWQRLSLRTRGRTRLCRFG